MKNRLSRSFAILLLILLIFSSLTIFNAKAQPRTIVVPDDYSSIQEAVDQATQGDIVFVKNGVYYNQTVTIDKALSLIGEDKTNTRIIGDWSINGTVVLVLHDGVVVQNLSLNSVTGAGVSGRGVHLLNVRNCVVSNCNSMNSGIGVWLYGSSENTIEDNYLVGENTNHFNYGIKLQNSHLNSILRNNVTDYDYGFGIVLDYSTGNNLNGNQILNNYHGIWLNSANNNDLTDNNVSITRNIFVGRSEQMMLGSFGIRLFSSTNNTIKNNDVLGVPKGIQIVASSYYNLIKNNTMNNSTYGLELANNSCNNLIVGNKISNSDYGLEIKYASNNTISANNITDNLVGANLENSSANLVYHNNFVTNTIQIFDNNTTSENTWNDSSEGNYWSNYNGTDNNKDETGDTPYVIDENNQDNYPLMTPLSIMDPTSSSEPEFPTTIVASVVILTSAVVGILRYFKKRIS